jgi:translation initiation factor 2A
LDGDENLSKAALKNKKKREAKKAKDAADKAAGLNPVEGTDMSPSKAPASARSPERRDRRHHDRHRSQNGDVRPRSQNRQRAPSQRRNSPQKTHNAEPGTPAPNGQIATSGSIPEPPDLTVTSPGGGGSPQEKKIRALTKKLRAIDDLKMRRAGGEKLEATQIKKMDTEDAVRKELESLGWTDT